ncbi:c-type cytochrome biogenesis protein CcmI [Maritimibacter dapengensis]|uniref:C-type cytochrome biogenesis protein CcmI n=1 Tax=Maritimibacter dapengensis TaxID=2836868 RepID=A0ABS6T1V0_9RHOB|nr:c-type cytochrome biogenesis protein CcmI [Maritimibacter dapengensis]MBV7379208.1 c-type cytochrome biogenesis protein CcmI [Maritimibacter dapengensis]
MGFWIVVITAAIGIVLVLGYALFSPARDTARATAEYDMEIYRDQLKELERDKARGVIREEEAKRAEVEISRRLLDADRALQASTGAKGAPKVASITGIALIAAVVIGGGAWVYSSIGAPGYADLPLAERMAIAANARENRPNQADVESQLPDWEGPGDEVDAEYAQLVVQLREAVSRRPDDVQGLSLLAQHEANIGNYRAAYGAQERLIAQQGDNADAAEYAELAEMMILAAGGYVSPEAERALEAALARDESNQIARYYSGLMFAQTGRADLAFRIWRVLYETSPIDAPWMGPLAAQLPELARIAGVNYTLPERDGDPGLSGPSPREIANAEQFSPEQRQQMLQSMVDNLMGRLAEQGGTAPEWARLIAALGLIGETERAAAIWGEAQGRFGAHPADLDLIRQAAVEAGLADGEAPALPGPSADDIENAAGMSAEDRGQMVTDMVERLASRIEAEGGSPEEWAQLIRVLTVQGETTRAADAWRDAQAAYADDEAALATIRAAAEAAGVTQ